jgi:hypothetical protein
MRRVQLLAAVGTLILGAACSSPQPAAPSANQIAGAWLVNAMLSAVSGGECVGADLQDAIGRRDVFLAALAGSATVDATITSQGMGTSCAYTGSDSGGGLSLTMTSCRSGRVVNVQCGSGQRRDLQIVAGVLQGRPDSRVGTGPASEATVWNVFAAGSSQVVGVLNLTATSTWVYLGLPLSNYHPFTGTVFPGYDDGTISVPADPNPWCLPCGWFR